MTSFSISCWIIVSSNSVIIMFASTGPKEDPILTPSFCSYNLLLKVNAVFVQVSNISFFKVLFLSLRIESVQNNTTIIDRHNNWKALKIKELKPCLNSGLKASKELHLF